MKGAVEIVFIVAAAISAALAAAVFLTGIIFKRLRTRPFVRIIVFIAFSDMAGSIGSSFGFPRNGSDLCPAQSFLSLFFYKASWSWIVMLSYQLNQFALNGAFGLNAVYMHLLCWLLPLISTLLPLVQVKYGRADDDSSPSGWCFLSTDNNKNDRLFWWSAVSFYFFLAACMILTVLFSIRMNFLVGTPEQVTRSPKLKSILTTVYWYPMGMIVTWLPNLIMAILLASSTIPATNVTTLVFDIVSILATQNGTITAFIFFYLSKEARKRWTVAFVGRPANSSIVRTDRAAQVLEDEDDDGNVVSSLHINSTSGASSSNSGFRWSVWNAMRASGGRGSLGERDGEAGAVGGTSEHKSSGSRKSSSLFRDSVDSRGQSADKDKTVDVEFASHSYTEFRDPGSSK